MREHYGRGRTLYSEGDKSQVPELSRPVIPPGDGQAVYWVAITTHAQDCIIESEQGSSEKNK